jgi:hypothetical protein
MLDSGRLSAQQQQEALQQIISLNQQIKDAATNAVQTFTVPARLALNLARDTALGRSTTKDLLAIRKAILRFIATHRHNLAALTDAYNQLADINQQLGSSAQSALGGSSRQAPGRSIASWVLGLTPEQRAALRAQVVADRTRRDSARPRSRRRRLHHRPRRTPDPGARTRTHDLRSGQSDGQPRPVQPSPPHPRAAHRGRRNARLTGSWPCPDRVRRRPARAEPGLDGHRPGRRFPPELRLRLRRRIRPADAPQPDRHRHTRPSTSTTTS